MNLNATLIAQFVVFFILAMVTMKFVWPPLMNALDERAKKIADGLAAADQGKAAMAAAEKRVQAELAGARDEGRDACPPQPQPEAVRSAARGWRLSAGPSARR